jgi:hypothetical protein
MDDSIPCEICGQSIPFGLFSRHMTECHSNINSRARNIVYPISYFIPEDEDIFIDDEEDDDDIDRYITSSSQVDGNLRTFLNNHFNRVDRRNSGSLGNSPPAHISLVISSSLGSERGGEKIEIGVIADIDKISVLSNAKLEDEIICVICQDVISSTYRTLICYHIYCDECISEWFKTKTKCPICQKDFLKEKNEI